MDDLETSVNGRRTAHGSRHSLDRSNGSMHDDMLSNRRSLHGRSYLDDLERSVNGRARRCSIDDLERSTNGRRSSHGVQLSLDCDISTHGTVRKVPLVDDLETSVNGRRNLHSPRLSLDDSNGSSHADMLSNRRFSSHGRSSLDGSMNGNSWHDDLACDASISKTTSPTNPQQTHISSPTAQYPIPRSASWTELMPWLTPIETITEAHDDEEEEDDNDDCEHIEDQLFLDSSRRSTMSAMERLREKCLNTSVHNLSAHDKKGSPRVLNATSRAVVTMDAALASIRRPCEEIPPASVEA